MANYQEMYLHLMRETEKAIRILVKAQQDCEELYMKDHGPVLRILPSQSQPIAGAAPEHVKECDPIS